MCLYLKHSSGTRVKVEFGFAIKDFTIKTAGLVEKSGIVNTFECGEAWGYKDFMPRSKCLASLFRGALVVEVRMKPAVNPPPFIPDNPSMCNIIQDLFMDVDYADVVFEVGGRGCATNEAKRPKNSSTKFYAHKLILRKAAPQLAELCISDESQSPLHIEIPNMSPDIFKDMLLYFMDVLFLVLDTTPHVRRKSLKLPTSTALQISSSRPKHTMLPHCQLLQRMYWSIFSSLIQ